LGDDGGVVVVVVVVMVIGGGIIGNTAVCGCLCIHFALLIAAW
jgi:hypothetical protein